MSILIEEISIYITQQGVVASLQYQQAFFFTFVR